MWPRSRTGHSSSRKFGHPGLTFTFLRALASPCGPYRLGFTGCIGWVAVDCCFSPCPHFSALLTCPVCLHPFPPHIFPFPFSLSLAPIYSHSRRPLAVIDCGGPHGGQPPLTNGMERKHISYTRDRSTPKWHPPPRLPLVPVYYPYTPITLFLEFQVKNV